MASDLVHFFKFTKNHGLSQFLRAIAHFQAVNMRRIFFNLYEKSLFPSSYGFTKTR
jgi:hypothetical protein